MSLEKSVSEMQQSHTKGVADIVEMVDYLESNAEAIKNHANDAIAQTGQNVVHYYVDPDIGDDTFAGSSADLPFKTLEQALTLTTGRAFNGCRINIYINGNDTYVIDKSYFVYNRTIKISALDVNFKPTISIGARFIGEGLGGYGFSLYESTIEFKSLFLYTPLLSELVGQEGNNNVTNRGILEPTRSCNNVILDDCGLNMGDLPLLVFSAGNNLSATIMDCSIAIRAGKSSDFSPIHINESTANISFFSLAFGNSGLLYENNSLISGVNYHNGVPINIVSNKLIAEGVL